MAHFYDRKGNPIKDVMKWAPLMEDDKYRQVALTEIGDIRVSTVWLGIDYNFSNPGHPPIIFESLVFGGPLNDELIRYSTEEAALAGHDRLVARTKELLAKWEIR